MKLVLLTLTLVAAVFARPSPDVSHIAGKKQKKDISSYEAATGSIDGNYAAIDQHPELFTQQGDFIPSSDLQLPVQESSDFLGKDLISFAEAFARQSDENFASQDVKVYKQDEVIAPQVKNYKQVYFYAAPETETEAPQYLRIAFAPSSTKNTNVIFVKAPTPGPIIPQIVTPNRHDFEDKTKVYVFVKDAENLGKVLTLPAPVPVKTKPEVFIVKYKNQADAQKVVASGVAEHEAGSINGVGDQNAFVNNFGPQNIDFQQNLNFENDIRSGGRSINVVPASADNNESAGSQVDNKGKDDESSTPSTSGQENSDSSSGGFTSTDNVEARSGVTDTKKVTISSLEEENTSSSSGVKSDDAGSPGALADKPDDALSPSN